MSHALGLPSCMLAYDFLSENRNTIYVSCRDKDPRPSGGFMGYFRNQPHNLHMAGASIYNSPLNRPLSNNDNDNEVEIIIDVSQKYCNSIALICAPYISIN